jgi:hypothetical protein
MSEQVPEFVVKAMSMRYSCSPELLMDAGLLCSPSEPVSRWRRLRWAFRAKRDALRYRIAHAIYPFREDD